MNSFYRLPVFLQWITASLLLLAGLCPVIIIMEYSVGRTYLYTLFLIYIPLAQLTFTPMFRLSRIYTYYSPMLLGYLANKQQIELHSGTSFDYLFVMRKTKPGIKTRNKILQYHLEGLLAIISKIEQNTVSADVKIVGTSYFFNSRTLERIGFEIQEPSLFHRFNLLVNFIDLFWMYSLAKGNIQFPKLWDAKKASISGERLVENKKYILVLYQHLTRLTD
jgi:hypothetical protein